MQLLFEHVDLYIQFVSQAAENLATLRMCVDIVRFDQAAGDKLPNQ